jgi:hypothetical protein
VHDAWISELTSRIHINADNTCVVLIGHIANELSMKHIRGSSSAAPKDNSRVMLISSRSVTRQRHAEGAVLSDAPAWVDIASEGSNVND